jgi:hypothetical protein
MLSAIMEMKPWKRWADRLMETTSTLCTSCRYPLKCFWLSIDFLFVLFLQKQRTNLLIYLHSQLRVSTMWPPIRAHLCSSFNNRVSFKFRAIVLKLKV